METKLINTHSHINMLKEYSTEAAIKELEQENIISIVPSSSPTDIFEVDDVIKKSKNLFNSKQRERPFVESENLPQKKRAIKTLFKMARVARFELATFWFVAKRSIQLGYTRIFNFVCFAVFQLSRAYLDLFRFCSRITPYGQPGYTHKFDFYQNCLHFKCISNIKFFQLK